MNIKDIKNNYGENIYNEIKKLIIKGDIIFDKLTFLANEGVSLNNNIIKTDILNILSISYREGEVTFVEDLLEGINKNIKINKNKLLLLELSIFFLKKIVITRDVISKYKNIFDEFNIFINKNFFNKKYKNIVKDYIRYIIITKKYIKKIEQQISDEKYIINFFSIIKNVLSNIDYVQDKHVEYMMSKIDLIPDNFFNNNIKLIKLRKELIDFYKEKKNENKRERELAQIKNFNKERLQIVKNISKNFIGKEDIVRKVFDSIEKSVYKINKRPVTLLFSGYSGTGKTELGKNIAEIFGGSPLIFSLGNFFADHAMSTILGAPPGYTGYDNKTIIEKYINDIKAKQETNGTKLPIIPVLIFDEIEKASPVIQNVFLELFDMGQLTLLSGRIVDLSNSIIILTSNIGVEKEEKIGFTEKVDKQTLYKQEEENIIKELEKTIRIEILNRIDDFFYFTPNTEKELVKIKEKKIEEIILKIMNNYFFQNLINKEYTFEDILKKVKAKIKQDNFKTENIRLLEKEIEKKMIEIFFH